MEASQYIYLELDDALELHRQVMLRTGDAPQPLRAAGILESALNRPRMAAFYEGVDLIRQATLLAVGVAEAQAFLEGNKRTAYAVLDVFLRINGFALGGDPLEIAKQLEMLGARCDSLDAATGRFETWLRGRVVPSDV